jgi:hypothetical protein
MTEEDIYRLFETAYNSFDSEGSTPETEELIQKALYAASDAGFSAEEIEEYRVIYVCLNPLCCLLTSAFCLPELFALSRGATPNNGRAGQRATRGANR